MRSNGSWRAVRVLGGGLALWGLALSGCESPPAVPKAPPDPERIIAKALTLTPDAEMGRRAFRGWCIFCHGDQYAGEPPTDFDLGEGNPRRFRGYHELSFEEHVAVIVKGYVSPSSGNQNMPAFAMRISPQEIADIAAYERTIMELSGPYRENAPRTWVEGGVP